jgi:hypothetical protein
MPDFMVRVFGHVSYHVSAMERIFRAGYLGPPVPAGASLMPKPVAPSAAPHPRAEGRHRNDIGPRVNTWTTVSCTPHRANADGRKQALSPIMRSGH